MTRRANCHMSEGGPPGYDICQCGKFAFVYDLSEIDVDSDGYLVRCDECGVYMTPIGKIHEKESAEAVQA